MIEKLKRHVDELSAVSPSDDITGLFRSIFRGRYKAILEQ